MEVKILKVIERHQILMLALRKQVSQIKAAEELGLSLSHTKLLMRKLKKAMAIQALHTIRASVSFITPTLSSTSAEQLYICLYPY